jgi:acyl-CoA thioester hydrolase
VGKRVTVPVTVEFEDVDLFGIANHARLVSFLERARMRLFAAAGVDLDDARVRPVLYDMKVRFREPARLMEVLDVSAEVEAVDSFLLHLHYEIRRGEALVLRARSQIAFRDPEGDGPLPVPAELVAGL